MSAPTITVSAPQATPGPAAPASASRHGARAAIAAGRVAQVRLHAREIGWLLGVLSVTLGLCGLPYLVAAHWGPPDLQRLGTFWFARDFSQYQAAMREGARQAGWLIHDHFTAESHAPALMYPLYVGLGKFAVRLGADPLGVFSGAEWLGRIAVVLALFAFAATFARPAAVRRLALLLALGTLGLDAFGAPLRLLLGGLASPAAAWLPDTINPYLEISSFGVLLSAPHLMLGLALTLLAAPLYLRAIRPFQPTPPAVDPTPAALDHASAPVALGRAHDPIAPALSASPGGPAPDPLGRAPGPTSLGDAPPRSRRDRGSAPASRAWPASPAGAASRRLLWLALLGADVLALAIVHTFNVPVLVSVLALHALWTGRRAWPAALVAAVAAAPMALYSLLLFSTDPFWAATYGAQNLMPAPPPWALPFDFGVVLLAAPLAWPVVRAWPAEQRRLLLLWVGLGLLWMYAPVPYQRRFAFGVQPGLAVLAAVGIVHLNWRLRRRPISRRVTNYLLVVAGVATWLLVYVSLIASAARNQPAEVYLWSRPEAAAAAWLGDHSTIQDVVLASTPFANALVGAIDGRVVHGHVVATFDSDAKEALVARFYAAETPPDERQRLLQTAHATIVAVGPRERALGIDADALRHQPSLRLVYDRDGVELWRVAS